MRHNTLCLISNNSNFINNLFWFFLWWLLFITTWWWTRTWLSTLIIFESFIVNYLVKNICIFWDHDAEWKSAFFSKFLSYNFFKDFNIALSIDEVGAILILMTEFDVLVFMFLKFLWDLSCFFLDIFKWKNLEISHCCLKFSDSFWLKSCFGDIEFVTFVFVLFY